MINRIVNSWQGRKRGEGKHAVGKKVIVYHKLLIIHLLNNFFTLWLIIRSIFFHFHRMQHGALWVVLLHSKSLWIRKSISVTVLIALLILLRIGRSGTIIMNLKWCGCNDKAQVKQEKKKMRYYLISMAVNLISCI